MNKIAQVLTWQLRIQTRILLLKSLMLLLCTSVLLTVINNECKYDSCIHKNALVVGRLVRDRIDLKNYTIIILDTKSMQSLPKKQSVRTNMETCTLV